MQYSLLAREIPFQKTPPKLRLTSFLMHAAKSARSEAATQNSEVPSVLQSSIIKISASIPEPSRPHRIFSTVAGISSRSLYAATMIVIPFMDPIVSQTKLRWSGTSSVSHQRYLFALCCLHVGIQLETSTFCSTHPHVCPKFGDLRMSSMLFSERLPYSCSALSAHG